jgi:hypothetical protein
MRNKRAQASTCLIETDGITVWVNGYDGCCWGRFGIDIHHKAERQIRYGMECLECVTALPSAPMTGTHWEQFKSGMFRHHNVAVDDSFILGWLK